VPYHNTFANSRTYNKVFKWHVLNNSIGFTYGYLRLTPLGLGIDVDAAHPEIKIATDEIGGT